MLYTASLRRSASEFYELEQIFNSQIIEEILVENQFESKEEAEELAELEANKKVKMAIKNIQEKNKDTVGWILIPGTKINYPVMYTPEDPEYYLRRSFEKEYSLNGVPFVSHKTSMFPRSDNVLIHGHHMNDGSMFSQLVLYKDKIFLEEHPAIEVYTLEGKEIYDIIAVIPTEVYSKKGDEFNYHDFITAKDKEGFDQYVQVAKKLSLHDTGVTAEYGDRLLTLSTCAYHVNNGRFVVIGREKE